MTTPTTPEGPVVGYGRFAPTFEVVRHIVSFLKWRFSQLPQGAYRYDDSDESPEQKNTEIFIGADTPIRTQVVGKRPAITVLRGQIAGAGLGLGDRAFLDFATGAKVRMDMYPTTLMINILSTEPVEAEGIAWFVMEQISALRDEIAKASNGLILYLGQRMMLSPPSPAGTLVDSTEVEWTAVVLACPCYLHHQVTMLPLNRPILGGVDFTVTTTPPTEKPAGQVPLQGTAIAQPKPQELPQNSQSEASSSEPLQVQIKAR